MPTLYYITLLSEISNKEANLYFHTIYGKFIVFQN